MQLSQFTTVELVAGDEVSVTGPADHDHDLLLLHFAIVQGAEVVAGTAEMQRFAWIGHAPRGNLQEGPATGHGVAVVLIKDAAARVETIVWSEALTVNRRQTGA